MSTWFVGGAARLFVFCCVFLLPRAAKRDFYREKRLMLKQCSFKGDGKEVYCVICGDELNEEKIAGMDEDGNAYCAIHTTKGGAE